MPLDQDIERLAQVPVFASMDQEALRLLAFASETRLHRPGDILFRRGDAGEGGILVLSGRVALQETTPDGTPIDEATDPVIGSGMLIGEPALLAPVLHVATAVVRERSSLLRISRALFLRVLHEYPANAISVRRHWARTLRRRIDRIRAEIRR